MVMVTDEEHARAKARARELGLTLRELVVAALDAYQAPPSLADLEARIAKVECRTLKLEARSRA